MEELQNRIDDFSQDEVISLIKLIEKAKERISTTSLTISEIAYELGFEHPSSFNKLFKSKTKLSPLEFRQSFN